MKKKNDYKYATSIQYLLRNNNQKVNCMNDCRQVVCSVLRYNISE